MRHVPFCDLKRLSEFDLEFRPTLEALHVDATDPLDP